MADVTLINPATGGSGTVPVDKLTQALADGLHPTTPIRMFNPATGGQGDVPPEKAHQAISDGLVPVGSREHRVAATPKLESFLRGAAQGATLGFGDELTGAVEGAYHAATGPESLGDAYRRSRDESRANNSVAEDANPKTYLGGQLGGGLAGAALTGGASEAGLIARLGQGALAGAASGAGASDADLTQGDVGGVARDAAIGGALGLGGTAALGAAGAVGKAALRKAGQFIDPLTSRSLAMGAMGKEMDPIRGRLFQRSIQTLSDEGLMPATGNTSSLVSHFAQAKDKVGNDIGTMMRNAEKDAPLFSEIVDQPVLDPAAQKGIDKLIFAAPVSERNGLQIEFDDLSRKMDAASGSVEKLWEIKRNVGDHIGVKWQAHANPAMIQMKQDIYGALKGHIEGVINELAESNPDKYANLSKMNKVYSAIETVDDALAKKEGDEAANATPLGMKFRNAVTAIGVGGATGNPGAGIASAVINSAAGSTRGQLGRAKVGEAIARNVPAVKTWFAAQHPNLSINDPELAAAVKALGSAGPRPPPNIVKAALPAITQQLQPAHYQSEFEGKLHDPADIAAERTRLAVLPVAQRAKALSALNKDGTMLHPPPPPPPPAQPLNMSQIAQRARQFGVQ